MSKQRQQSSEHQRMPSQSVTVRRRTGGVLSILILATVVLAVGAILLLKEGRPPTATVVSASDVSAATVSSASSSAGPAGGSAVDQLSRGANEKRPALVFMHSTTCQSCIDMMKVVDQVYPEFKDQLVLVDVDIYDEANGPLMDSLGLRYIPTVVVFNSKGKASQNVGAMKADAFRTFLRQRALGG